MNRLTVPLLLTALGVTPAAGQPYLPLLDEQRQALLHEALSGEIAKDHVIQITRHHRIQGSRGYRDAATYVVEQLHGYGFSEEDAFVESFPSDGRIEYQTWQSPSGWHVESAELRMVEPYDERIVGYPEIAMSLITYANPGDVTAELVWVGSGTRDADYAGKDVAGKFVLATGYGGSVHRLAVLEYGAAGVVVYLDDERAREYPDMLQYTGMWPRSDELERVTFGFNLSHRQGERLRALLEHGQRVVLRGQVRGVGLESFFMDVPVARIQGADPASGTLVFSAHLDHPKESANDNASGSAALLDIARSLTMLIDEGRLPRPRRSIHFLWVPEWYGTMAYLDRHPEVRGPGMGGTYLANINMDMVGEHPEVLHTKLIITRVPASVPTALNDVLANMAAMVDRMDVRTPRGSLSEFNYRMTPYSGGSDHMMFIDRDIPGVMFSHSPDYTHHTSEDTPDKVDPVELERSEIIAAATMLYLSDLSEDEAVDLVSLVAAGAAQRLGHAARQARSLLDNVPPGADGSDGKPTPDDWHEARNVIAHVADWEREALGSVLFYNSEPPVRRAVEAARAMVGQQEEAALAELGRHAAALGIPTTTSWERTPDHRVPVRLTRGPLDFGLPASRLADADATWYLTGALALSGDERFELVNLIDGQRSVTQLRDALSAEYRPIPLEAISHYVDDLVEVGVVEWKR